MQKSKTIACQVRDIVTNVNFVYYACYNDKRTNGRRRLKFCTMRGMETAEQEQEVVIEIKTHLKQAGIDVVSVEWINSTSSTPYGDRTYKAVSVVFNDVVAP